MTSCRTDHPLRAVRRTVNLALKNIEPLLSGMYAADIKGGRPSIAPEKLLRAMLLQIFYSIRSERLLMEQTQYNLLFRWFIGLSMDDTVWVPTVFTKNRERLIEHDAVIELFNEVLAIANKNDWLSGEHFSVDGTLIQAWAGHKSFARKDGSDDDTGNFKGKSRSNDTHESTTDADARLYRKGNTASELRFMGHTLSDNRHGLIASAMVTTADGYAEREAAKIMIADAKQVAARECANHTGCRQGLRRSRVHRVVDGHERAAPCGAEHSQPQVSGARTHCGQRWLRHLAAKAQAHRTGIWLGQVHWTDSPGDGAWIEEGGPVVCADDGGLQPHAHAHPGTNPSADDVEAGKRCKTTSKLPEIDPESVQFPNREISFEIFRSCG